MMNYVEFMQNSTNVGLALVLLTSAIIIFLLALIIRQQSSFKKLSAISESLSRLHESFIRTNLNLESVASRLQNIEAQSTEFLENYQLSKAELSRMAESMRDESQLTKAIELARSGSVAQEITLTTGLSEDEANALVKFHGTSKR